MIIQGGLYVHLWRWFTKKYKGRVRARVKVPFFWRVLSLLGMLPLGMLIFYIIFSKSGGKYPLAAGDSTDPYFFGSVFAVLIPVLVYLLIVDKVLKGIVTKRSGKEIAKDVALDVAKAAAVMAAEVV